MNAQTPSIIAIHLAKLASNTSSERAQANFTETVKERGIELAGDGAFTVDLENGQRFHVRVTEVVADAVQIKARDLAVGDVLIVEGEMLNVSSVKLVDRRVEFELIERFDTFVYAADEHVFIKQRG